MTDIKIVGYKRRFDNRVLLVLESHPVEEGFHIAEKCYPGIWYHPEFDPIVEMVPVSHEFFADADENRTECHAAIGQLGGKEKVMAMFMDLLAKWAEAVGK